jgi:hypothetical protein
MIISLLSFLFVFLSSAPAYPAVFNVASGDVAGLIAAINAANSNGEENTINLVPGTYTLTGADNNSSGSGPNGLPVITGAMTINGANAETTVIERASGVPPAFFRIFEVAVKANVTMNGITIRNGDLIGTPPLGLRGGGVLNFGNLTVKRSIIERNIGGRRGDGGGIANLGTVTVIDSSIATNSADSEDGFGDGGGLVNIGTAIIQNSTIARNFAWHGGGLANLSGTMEVSNTTIANNQTVTGGAGISSAGAGITTVMNSTISGNSGKGEFAGPFDTPVTARGGGISGTVALQNSILALNTVTGAPGSDPALGPDCFGSITSLGNNIVGDLSDCSINLQPTDLTGDPGLDAFIDSGAPANGRFPLLPGSPAIDAGNAAACPATDQVDTPRLGPCDIGAIEFYPVVNDLVALGNLTTAFDPTPVSGGPAGTFRITADFTNPSNQAIVHPFVEVVELTGGNLLLNADGGAGGVGARLTSSNGSGTPLEPGASSTFEFLIGLQKPEPFTFFVNMLGAPGTSNPSVSMR